MSTLNININNVQPLDTILTGLSGLAYSGNQGLFIKVNATADGFEFAAGSGGVPYIGATQDVDLGEYELKAGQIEYDQTPTGAAGVAVTRWNDSIGTLETTLKGGNVVLKHGRDLFERVVNKTGIQLTKAAYQAVRVSTAQGQRLGVALAQANNDNNSADTIGLVVETIDNNQEGMIYVVGEINGINTTGSLQSETWADGDVLYLSPTTAGRITNVKPVAPQHLVVIGYVVYAHATQGKIYVKVMNGFELGELHDVDTTGATNGQVLKYNGTIWTAQTDLNSGVWGSITGTLSSQTDLQTALDGKVDENAAITGATKTKITYDAKGLVTSGADATTADIADSSNKRYVTDAQLTVIGNTSGTNSGNQTLANTSDATSHTVTLSATGGSVQLVEGSGITLTTTGTAADGIITIASSGGSPSGVAGAVQFSNGSAFASDATNFFWDDANNRLGIGTATPTDTLHNTGTTRLDGLLKFAGTTSAFPALKRNSTELQVRLADDSGFAPLQALGGTFNGNTYIKALGVNQTLTGNFGGMFFAVNTGSMSFAMTGTTLGFYNTAASDLVEGQIRTNGVQISNILFGTPNASAILDVASTTKGFAMPRMTGAQVEAISTPIEGLIAYASSAGATSVKSKGVYHYTGSAWEKISGQTVATITFIIDGGGSAITTGIKGDIEIPFACSINQVTMLADTSGSIVVDIWKDTYANYPPTVGDTITASAKPTISAATKSQDATLTGWTNTISAGDTLRFNVDSASTVTRVTISLKITKS